MSLPLPSSPHCVPTTTVAGTTLLRPATAPDYATFGRRSPSRARRPGHERVGAAARCATIGQCGRLSAGPGRPSRPRRR